MANLFRTMFGGIKRDFTPKLIPGLVRDAKQRVEQSSQPPHEERISRVEFARRYRNLQICIYVCWIFGIFAAVQALRIDAWLFSLGATLTSILMFCYSLGMIFRASVARGVWRTWGHSRYPKSVSFANYLTVLLRNPMELLPLNLPNVDEQRGVTK